MSRCFRLLATIALLCVGIVSVSVAQKDDTVFTCNKIAVTCEGMSSTDFVFGIMSLTGIAGAPIGDNWTTPATTGDHGVGTMQYTRQNMGQLFGIANDNRGVYVTAAAIYDTWNQAWGTINNVNHPAATGGATNENRGSVYLVANHVITEIADLPNIGQGLGNICYNKQHDRLYVTNFHDGLIYVLTPAGATAGTFDPQFDGNSYGMTGNFVTLGQRPWGIAVWGSNINNSVLYYARWVYDGGTSSAVLAQNANARNEIWSVKLDAAGLPIPTTEVLVATVPVLSPYNYSNPVADLEISTDGSRMLVAERTMYGTQTSAHSSRLLELRRSSSASTVWNWEPLPKFKLGELSTQGHNATGGCDYGDINLDGKDQCSGTVYGMSDYIPSTWGYVYGVQVLPSTGGTAATSKLIDLNNVPGTQDKTHLGDVDYRRCLDCPPLQDDQCGQFVPDTMGGTCCKGGLLSVSPAGVPNVVSVGYTVTNGVIQGFTSNCTYTSAPAVVAGTSSGLLTITGACNLQQLYASLQTTSPTGAVTISWTVTFSNGTKCVYVSNVTGCPPPPRVCSDKIDVKQCNCGPNASQSYLDIFVTNAATPSSTICGVLITKLDVTNTPQTGYWASGSYQNPGWTSVSVASSPVVYSPLNIPFGGQLHTQLYFFGTSFTGSIVIQVIHCSGSGQNIVYDTCTYHWAPINPWTPATDKGQLPSISSVKSKYDKLYAVPFKLVGPATPINICPVKYWSVAILGDATDGAKIVAVTGAEQYPEAETQKEGLALKNSMSASRTALFESQQEISLGRGDSSGAFTIVVANSRPTRLRYSLYDATGSLIGTDTVVVDSGSTVDVKPITMKPRNDDFLMVDGYPNPAAETYTARYITGSSQRVTLSISMATGELVEEIDEGMVPAGIHERSIDISKLANGTYMMRMKSASGLVSEMVKIVVKR